MTRRSVSLALCGLAVVLAGCSSGTTATKTGATTTIRRSVPTSRLDALIASTTPSVTRAAPPAAGTAAVVPDSVPDAVSPFTGPAVRTTARTTVAGRVVSRPNDNVHLGDTGPGVTQIQVALAALGYKVSADGRFGAQTELAVKSFQTKNTLGSDGIVGPATWSKLQGTHGSPTTKAPATTIKAPAPTIKSTTTTRH